MDDMIIYMFKKLFEFDTSEATGIKQTLSEYSNDTYNVVTSLHNTGIKPVASVIISMLLVLELARNASRIEADQQLGVKIIAATMFKSVLLVWAAQNAMMFLNAINQIVQNITKNIDEAQKSLPQLPDISDKVSNAEMMDKAGMVMLLIIPFIVAMAAVLIVKLMVVMRFIELYFMTAFASLPIAFLGHPDTKSMGIGYLQKYAAVSLQAATLMLATKIYPHLPAVNAISIGNPEGSLSGWIIQNYATFLLAPVLLIVLVFASGKVAKALVGQ